MVDLIMKEITLRILSAMLTGLAIILLGVSCIIVSLKLDKTINTLEQTSRLAAGNHQLIQDLANDQVLKFYQLEKRIKDLEAWQNDLNSVFFDNVTVTNMP
jgi:uncharacterized protein YoxC